MKPINDFLDAVKSVVKRIMRDIARKLNKITGGELSPNAVTFTALFMHVPIALLIASGHHIWAGLLLIFFGLFDTLDGELARIQGTESPVGMMLDSSTDRMKEILLYIGIAYFLVDRAATTTWEPAQIAALVAGAVGGSVLVSYINAWGDAVLSATPQKKHAVNATFRSGLMRFEVRMFLIIFGLLTGWLLPIVGLIAILVWLTAFERLNNVIKRLS